MWMKNINGILSVHTRHCVACVLTPFANILTRLSRNRIFFPLIFSWWMGSVFLLKFAVNTLLSTHFRLFKEVLCLRFREARWKTWKKAVGKMKHEKYMRERWKVWERETRSRKDETAIGEKQEEEEGRYGAPGGMNNGRGGMRGRVRQVGTWDRTRCEVQAAPLLALAFKP